MDPRLTDINLTMRTMDTDDRDDSRRELAFAILAVDENDHATLNWLAACCAKRAGDLTGYEPDEDDVPLWRRNLISAVWAALDATEGDTDMARDQFENAIGAWTP